MSTTKNIVTTMFIILIVNSLSLVSGYLIDAKVTALMRAARARDSS
jgi:general stress protein CsbA